MKREWLQRHIKADKTTFSMELADGYVLEPVSYTHLDVYKRQVEHHMWRQMHIRTKMQQK